jgi:hypothetical protein
MRLLLVLLIPIAAFSFWLHRKGEQNEARLSDVAQRSVGVD